MIKPAVVGVVVKLGPQFLKAHKVRIKPPPPDFVAARARDSAFLESAEQRAQQHHRPPQGRRFLAIALGFHVVEVQVGGFKTYRTVVEARPFYAQVAKQIDELVYVADIGNIVNRNGLPR